MVKNLGNKLTPHSSGPEIRWIGVNSPMALRFLLPFFLLDRKPTPLRALIVCAPVAIA
jgi:hypothetical protein